MANWKKVVVSGSSAALKEVTNDPNIATATHLTNTVLTGSFTGSFKGDGTNLTGITAEWDGTLDISSQDVVSAQITGSGAPPSLIVSGSTGNDLEVSKNATIGGNLTADGTISGSTLSANLTAGEVVFAGADGVLSDDSTLTFNSSTKILSAENVSSKITSSNLTDTRVVFASTNGELVDDAKLVFNSTTKILSAEQIVARITSSNLTNTRVTFAGSSGELEDNAGLTFASDTLTAKQIVNDKTVATATQVANTRITGSFSGSFKGDGTGITGITAEWDGTLNVPSITGLGSAQVTGSGAPPSLIVSGSTGNDLEVSKNAQVSGIMKASDFDVIAAGAVTLFDTVGAHDLTLGASSTKIKIPGGLEVAGSASFTNASNLSVSDKYILLNSGSISGGSGGIVIQEENEQDVGQIFGFKSGSGAFDNITRRWGVADNYDADSASDFVPEAFMANVVVGTDNTVPAATSLYTQKGNIFVGTTDGEIYIYG